MKYTVVIYTWSSMLNYFEISLSSKELKNSFNAKLIKPSFSRLEKGKYFMFWKASLF